MKITKQARRDAKQLFRSCTATGLLDEGRARQVVTQVIAQKPRGFLAILSHFQRLVKLDLERRTAVVESAMPVTPELQASVTGELGRLYGNGLNISFAQNPGLIGGLRIKVGSDVFDGSVKARLAALEASL
jgi:F-type H+-transporting ATPase subunit delta